VVVGLGSELDLLELDDGLLALGLALPLFLLVFVFTKIEDLADGRHALRVDFDQVEPATFGLLQSLRSRHHPQLGPVIQHDPHLWNPDAVIHPDLRPSRIARHASTHRHVLLLLLPFFRGTPDSGRHKRRLDPSPTWHAAASHCDRDVPLGTQRRESPSVTPSRSPNANAALRPLATPRRMPTDVARTAMSIAIGINAEATRTHPAADLGSRKLGIADLRNQDPDAEMSRAAPLPPTRSPFA
jgi:hypothetical protein